MTNNSSNKSAPRPKNWLLAKSRQWHKWGGLLGGVFILITGASGILLNYKQPIFNAFGIEQGPPKPGNSGNAGKVKPKASQQKITTGAGLATVPVSLESALELAHAEWGDVPLERIELKDERGELIYKLKQKGSAELWINATTGSHFIKGEYERLGKAGADGVQARTTDWGKILIDLHTGKIGGEAGKAVMSFAALLLLLLTLSGVYMWVKPLLVRRQNARGKAHAVKPVGSAAPTPVPSPAPERELVEV